MSESRKLSEETVEGPVRLVKYPWSGKTVHHLSRLDIDELYDLEADAAEALPFVKVCHIVIHSYVFMSSFSEEGTFEGILFNFDRTRHSMLLHMGIDELVMVLRGAGNDYPSYVEMTYDEVRRDHRFSSHPIPPE